MLKSRRLHREEKDKDKLYTALRELYKDGVRVYTGRLPASEIVKRKIDDKMQPRKTDRLAHLSLSGRDRKSRNPYDSGE